MSTTSHAEEACNMIGRVTAPSRLNPSVRVLDGDDAERPDWIAVAQVEATLAVVDVLCDIAGELAAIRLQGETR